MIKFPLAQMSLLTTFLSLSPIAYSQALYTNNPNRLALFTALDALTRKPSYVLPTTSSQGSVTIHWEPVSGASSYNVVVQNPTNSGVFSNQTVSGTSATIAGLQKPFAYIATITSTPNNSSAPSNSVMLVPDESGKFYSRAIVDNRLLPDQTKRDPKSGRALAKADGLCCNSLFPPIPPRSHRH